MQQIRLTEFTESYAVSIEDGLPEYEMEVFFKTTKGKTYKGEFFESQLYPAHFDNLKGSDFEPEDIESWHPVTVDL